MMKREGEEEEGEEEEGEEKEGEEKDANLSKIAIEFN